jgi:hypothetical protein
MDEAGTEKAMEALSAYITIERGGEERADALLDFDAMAVKALDAAGARQAGQCRSPRYAGLRKPLIGFAAGMAAGLALAGGIFLLARPGPSAAELEESIRVECRSMAMEAFSDDVFSATGMEVENQISVRYSVE